MTRIRLTIAGLVFATTALAADKITDSASAVAAAKRYVKARCTPEAACKFKPEREGNQWRVWVKHPGGTLVLYFDTQGNLLRRVEAD